MKINTLTHGKLISLSGASLLFEYGDKTVNHLNFLE